MPATYDADVLVVALGADYDLDATPGLAEAGNEFYSVAGARGCGRPPRLPGGRVVIGVTGAPFKCPPAPSESRAAAARLLHGAGVREPADHVRHAVPARFRRRPRRPRRRRRVRRARHRVHPRPPRSALDVRAAGRARDGTELPFDLFLGRSAAPRAAGRRSRRHDRGRVHPGRTRGRSRPYPGVYAVGDVASVGTPKAGVFAEGAARVVAPALIAELRGARSPSPTRPRPCYIEFGADRVAASTSTSSPAPSPTGVQGAVRGPRAEKEAFGPTRRARWFGLHEEPEAR